MTQSIVTSIKLPKDLNQQLSEQVIADGYGMRGKSQWIVDSIIALLNLSEPDYVELIEYAANMEKLDSVISIRLPRQLAFEIDKAVRVVRTTYPELEGVRSSIVRASILQQLLR